MSRDLFRAEIGVAITDENSDAESHILRGTAVPGGDSGLQDAAPIGSQYLKDDGCLYMKTANAGATADWKKYATLDDVNSLQWRDKVKAVTATAAPSEGGTVDVTAFTDDDGTTLTAGDFADGDYIVFGFGGTEVIGQISGALVGNNATITYVGVDPLSASDTFVTQYYLPDPDGQEGYAIAHYDGTDVLKLADFDWALATGINLTGSYTPVGGDVTAGDSVEVAIAKLDDNLDDLTAAVGVAQGDQDMGTYTGSIINDNESAKQNLQQLETYLEGLAVPVSATQAAVTTLVTLDSVVVDNVREVKWMAHGVLDSDNSRVRAVEIHAIHNGTASADASAVDDTTYAKLKEGANFGAKFHVNLIGTGGSQVMALQVEASAAATFKSLRLGSI